MRHKLTATLALAALAGLACATAAPAASVATLPPSVVSTTPPSGQTDVDPGLTRITVTFSKEMMTERMWSWCSADPEAFPEADVDAIHYLGDKRTCVLPVRLRPGRTYVIWINCKGNNSFRDIGGRPAPPYLLVFETK